MSVLHGLSIKGLPTFITGAGGVCLLFCLGLTALQGADLLGKPVWNPSFSLLQVSTNTKLGKMAHYGPYFDDLPL